MKKILIIIAIVIIIGIAILAFFALRGNPSNTGVVGGGGTGTLPTTGTSSPFNPPAGNTITIGTPQGSVTVNNFYNNAPQVSVDHTAVLLTQTDPYNIVYYIPDGSFNILIASTSFKTAQIEAEAAFLQILGVSKTDACKLSVKVGSPIGINPDYAGQNLGLSFCSNGAFQAH